VRAIPRVHIDVKQLNEAPSDKAEMTVRLSLVNPETFQGVNQNKFPVMLVFFVGNEDNEVVFLRRFA